MAEQTAEQQAAMEAKMAAEGADVEETVQADYFGFEETKTVVLPDGNSWVEFKVMNEGQRRKYLNEQNKGIRINRATNDATIDTAPGDERWSLLRNTVIDWNLMRSGQKVPFSRANLEQFLEKADPRVVDVIEQEVRLAHPWLLQEMTVEDIDKEIENLEKMRKVALEREQGNVS